MRHQGIAVAGVDEAGRGPLAGPVTAACVVLPPGYCNSKLDDSKRMSPEDREEVYADILKSAVACAAVSVGPRRIELINIREATRLAMGLSAERVFRQISPSTRSARSRQARRNKPTFSGLYLLVDGDMAPRTSFPCEPIIKGDQKICSISAASVVAKVTRDRIMVLLERKYPGYLFSQHKGYATKEHYERIFRLGPCSIHRKSFAGIREFFEGAQGELWPDDSAPDDACEQSLLL